MMGSSTAKTWSSIKSVLSILADSIDSPTYFPDFLTNFIRDVIVARKDEDDDAWIKRVCRDICFTRRAEDGPDRWDVAVFDPRRLSSFPSSHIRSAESIALLAKFVRCCRDIKRIISTISTISTGQQQQQKNKLENVHVVFMPFEATKRIPNNAPKRHPLEPNDVNSGVTITTASGQIVIVVFRQQDACKVLIHELLHAADFPRFMTRLGRSVFGGKGDQLLSRVLHVESSRYFGVVECAVECMALILYVLWTKTSTLSSSPASRQLLIDSLNTRQLFDMMRSQSARLDTVAHRVLQHYGRNTPMASKPSKPSKSSSSTSVVFEKTHVFAYIVCVSAILQDFDSFSKFVKMTGFFDIDDDIDDDMTFAMNVVIPALEKWRIHGVSYPDSNDSNDLRVSL